MAPRQPTAAAVSLLHTHPPTAATLTSRPAPFCRQQAHSLGEGSAHDDAHRHVHHIAPAAGGRAQLGERRRDLWTLDTVPDTEPAMGSLPAEPLPPHGSAGPCILTAAGSHGSLWVAAVAAAAVARSWRVGEGAQGHAWRGVHLARNSSHLLPAGSCPAMQRWREGSQGCRPARPPSSSPAHVSRPHRIRHRPALPACFTYESPFWGWPCLFAMVLSQPARQAGSGTGTGRGEAAGRPARAQAAAPGKRPPSHRARLTACRVLVLPDFQPAGGVDILRWWSARHCPPATRAHCSRAGPKTKGTRVLHRPDIHCGLQGVSVFRRLATDRAALSVS